MGLRSLAPLILAAAIHAQQDPMRLLRQVRDKIADTLDRLPRYMCTETIERSLYEPAVDYSARTAAPRLQRRACDDPAVRRTTRVTTSDRLRLDVATTGAYQAEMYSWVGEGHFDERDLMDMVHEGAISNGSFAAVLTSVFRAGEAHFTYNGEMAQNGRALAEFGFQVAHDQSHYRYRNGRGNGWVITGYSGTFLVDPKTAGLVRLVLRTDRLPQETGDCSATTSLDYAPVRLQGVDFLLPSASVLRIVASSGAASENHTVFSRCHEFLGESTLQFETAPDTAAAPGHRDPAAGAPVIPSGLRFRLALAQQIDPDAAAVGDPVKARLLNPIWVSPAAIAPAGAAVSARIVRLRRFYGRAPSVSLGLKLQTVEVEGVAIPISAVLDSARASVKAKKGALQRRADLGTMQGSEPGLDTIEFRSAKQNFVIPAGGQSAWVTTSK